MTVRTVAELLRRFHTDDPADWARDVLDTLGEISASEINSGEADEGQVLLADGEGGAAWSAIEVTAEQVDSGEAVSGSVLTAGKFGAASWEAIEVTAEQVDSGEADEGQALLADGSGGADWGKVTAAGIDSGAAEEGKVLLADGSGGAGFDTLSGEYIDSGGSGSANKALVSDGDGGADWSLVGPAGLARSWTKAEFDVAADNLDEVTTVAAGVRTVLRFSLPSHRGLALVTVAGHTAWLCSTEWPQVGLSLGGIQFMSAKWTPTERHCSVLVSEDYAAAMRTSQGCSDRDTAGHQPTAGQTYTANGGLLFGWYAPSNNVSVLAEDTESKLVVESMWLIDDELRVAVKCERSTGAATLTGDLHVIY